MCLRYAYGGVSPSTWSVAPSFAIADELAAVRLTHSPKPDPAGTLAGASPPVFVVGPENVTPAGAVFSFAIVAGTPVVEPSPLRLHGTT